MSIKADVIKMNIEFDKNDMNRRHGQEEEEEEEARENIRGRDGKEEEEKKHVRSRVNVCQVDHQGSILVYFFFIGVMKSQQT